MLLRKKWLEISTCAEKTRMENGLYLEWSINMENIFAAMDPATKGRDIKHPAFS